MGMYADHGVEYHIIYKDGRKNIIASTHATDKRLLQSHYFNVRKHDWLSADAMYGHGSYSKKILDPDFDVELTNEEKCHLDMAIQQNPNTIQEHGWYDVNTISYTY